jgi:lauroyl/myristoyl acyltransferase
MNVLAADRADDQARPGPDEDLGIPGSRSVGPAERADDVAATSSAAPSAEPAGVSSEPVGVIGRRRSSGHATRSSDATSRRGRASSATPVAARDRPSPSPRRPGTRLRSRLLRAGSTLASRLPERVAVAAAEAIGAAWYRAAPARAAQGRLNLRRVCTWLVANDLASDRIRAAAADPRALERLLRSAFRHAARYYLEVARTATLAPDNIRRTLRIETPAALDAALAHGATIFVGLHFGAMELPAAYVAQRTGVAVTIPMETIGDPELQAWFEELRGATGIRIVGLREARRELTAALRRGEPVGLVGDRDLTGGGIDVEFFGAPTKFPVGPGLLALETGAAVSLVAVRRVAHVRYVGHVEPLAVPPEAAGTRRERLTAFLQAEARGFERIVAQAPEQWWALFFPIWPDLVARPTPETAR